MHKTCRWWLNRENHLSWSIIKYVCFRQRQENVFKNIYIYKYNVLRTFLYCFSTICDISCKSINYKLEYLNFILLYNCLQATCITILFILDVKSVKRLINCNFKTFKWNGKNRLGFNTTLAIRLITENHRMQLSLNNRCSLNIMYSYFLDRTRIIIYKWLQLY